MNPNVYSSYNKAIQVISSCTKVDHIKSARKYVNRFFKSFTTPSRSNYGPLKTFYADKLISDLYSKLLQELKEKEKSLDKVT